MVYAVWEHKPGFFLTGDYGTGKTLLSRVLVKECGREQFRFAIINNPRLRPLELIQEIYFQLSGNHPQGSQTKVELLRALKAALEENFDNGRYSVIIVDEAQSIDDDNFLEELRLLLNIQRDDSVLFTLLIVGQESFMGYIQRSPQFKQRLSLRYYVNHLKKQETRQYIQHRLHVAGLDKNVFTPSACDQIFSLSKGVPRVINTVCDLALLTGFIKQQASVDKDIVIQAGKDLDECFFQAAKEEAK